MADLKRAADHAGAETAYRGHAPRIWPSSGPRPPLRRRHCVPRVAPSSNFAPAGWSGVLVRMRHYTRQQPHDEPRQPESASRGADPAPGGPLLAHASDLGPRAAAPKMPKLPATPWPPALLPSLLSRLFVCLLATAGQPSIRAKKTAYQMYAEYRHRG